MNYAVIKTGGKQYKVSTGKTLTLDKLVQNDKKTLVFDEVLLVVNEGKISIGKPLVKGAKVQATFIENIKGEKIKVMKFKAKSRHRRTIGFRAEKSLVKIDKIEISSTHNGKNAKESTKTVRRASKK